MGQEQVRWGGSGGGGGKAKATVVPQSPSAGVLTPGAQHGLSVELGPLRGDSLKTSHMCGPNLMCGHPCRRRLARLVVGEQGAGRRGQTVCGRGEKVAISEPRRRWPSASRGARPWRNPASSTWSSISRLQAVKKSGAAHHPALRGPLPGRPRRQAGGAQPGLGSPQPWEGAAPPSEQRGGGKGEGGATRQL